MGKIARQWVVLGALLALGCGTSDKNPATTGGAAGQAVGGSSQGSSGSSGSGSSGESTGGNAGQGGSAGSAGQSAGGAGLVLGDTPAEACIAYAMAVCSRQVECANGSVETFPLPSCISASLGCPDTTSSPGATRTVAGLKACAEDYRTWPCDKVLAGELPPCVTPGQRAQSEPCVYSSQCSSLRCEALDGCGQCALEVGVGESCAAPDVDCAGAAQCSSVTEQCVAVQMGPVTPVGPNEPCTQGQACVQDHSCAGAPGATVCSPLPKADESCAGPARCGFGAYCPPDLTCRALPGMGEPCGLDALTEQPLHCQDELTCHFASDGMSGTCVPFPKLGEPCVITPYERDYELCDAGLHCDLTLSPPLCAGPGEPGDSCNTSADCPGYTRCTCPADMLDCTARRCIGVRFVGEPCGEPNYECHPAFQCTAGVCQPRELQGTFADTCGP